MSNYVACPKCGGAADILRFSWWGGVLGPRMLSHVKCRGCGNKYNGKTGAANTGRIALYMLVVGALCFVVFLALFTVLAMLSMNR